MGTAEFSRSVGNFSNYPVKLFRVDDVYGPDSVDFSNDKELNAKVQTRTVHQHVGAGAV